MSEMVSTSIRISKATKRLVERLVRHKGMSQQAIFTEGVDVLALMEGLKRLPLKKDEAGDE